MQLVGESLPNSQRHESLLRRISGTMSMNDRCKKCKELPYPRGFFQKEQLCWWCMFPRP